MLGKPYIALLHILLFAVIGNAQPNLANDATMSLGGSVSGQNVGFPYYGIYNLVPNGNLNGYIFNQSNNGCSATAQFSFGSPYSGWYTQSPSVFQPSGWNYQGGFNFGHSAAWTCNVQNAASPVHQSHAVLNGAIYNGALLLRTHFNNSGTQEMREYMYVKLARPLMHGKTYTIRYTVASVYPANSINEQQTWHDQLGVYLSSEPPNWQGSYLNYPITDVVPIVTTPTGQLVSDTAVIVQQEITGNGEQWLMIGCFAPTNLLSSSAPIDSVHTSYYIFDNFAIWDNQCDNPIFLTLPNPAISPACAPLNQYIYSTAGFSDYHWYINDSLQTENTVSFIYSSTQTHTLSLAAGTGACYDSISVEYPIQEIHLQLPNDTFLFCGDSISLDPESSGNVGIQWHEWTNLQSSEVTFNPAAYTISENGIYAIRTRSVTGCFFYDTLTVSPHQLPDFNLDNEAIPIILQRNSSCLNENDGFVEVTYPGLSGLTYQWSMALNSDTAHGIYNLPAGDYQVRIFDDSLRCDLLTLTIEQLLDSCAEVEGTVWLDTLTNCVYEPFEAGIPNVIIYTPETNQYAITDSLGHYSIRVPPGTHSISQAAFPFALMESHCQSTQIVSPSNLNQVISNIDFGDTLALETQNPAISTVFHNSIIPGTSGIAGYHAQNTGNTASPATFLFHLNDTLIPESWGAYSAGTWNALNFIGQTGNEFIWQDTLLPLQTVIIQVNYSVPPNPNLVGETLFSICQIIPLAGNSNPNDDYFELEQVVVGSFDPNQKLVQPVGQTHEGLISQTQESFNFQIDFQNTGTAPAMNVYVEDTLGQEFNLQSLQIFGASHPFEVEIRPNRLIRFVFPNINLPDSLSNEPLSHGWVRFRINKADGLDAPGTTFQNRAFIYFDYNEPVITNTTLNTIEDDIVLGQNLPTTSLVIYPNPASTLLTVQASDLHTELVVRDVFGRVRLRKKLGSTASSVIDVSQLNPGCYYLTLISTNGEIQTGIFSIVR
jgi:uncharacterized repeat protein (TIGR01451 family)